jgi:hypothetical protein
VILWKIPAKSPDFNPVEKFWAWLRKKLRSMDLAVAIAKRPILGKMMYKEQVRRLVKTRKAQTVASNCAQGLRRVCKEVIRKKGHATKGLTVLLAFLANGVIIVGVVVCGVRMQSPQCRYYSL